MIEIILFHWNILGFLGSVFLCLGKLGMLGYVWACLGKLNILGDVGYVGS